MRPLGDMNALAELLSSLLGRITSTYRCTSTVLASLFSVPSLLCAQAHKLFGQTGRNAPAAAQFTSWEECRIGIGSL